ncbi:nuclear transport factor 2 family protein [Chitinophaga sp. S165]|uniref:nuclear transport factor 2 family protein n=1 Tax=Chitinophaga sp. S165 TaxID=2135462 RepID=UPI000D71307B|nr:nuclear transport factor 2 family protein [Chitinophaga sp. S165]PWV54319.1 hypothetical protein C7475_1021076 [Chitinophaga sp. S165]
MNLPEVLSSLLAAQTNFNSKTYADCFSETAVVFDEGKTHTGRQEIKDWNEDTNTKYRTRLKPVGFYTEGEESILETEVSGTFSGSPLVLKYHFKLEDELIASLKITG